VAITELSMFFCPQIDLGRVALMRCECRPNFEPMRAMCGLRSGSEQRCIPGLWPKHSVRASFDALLCLFWPCLPVNARQNTSLITLSPGRRHLLQDYSTSQE
jgi:hypothetical protein